VTAAPILPLHIRADVMELKGIIVKLLGLSIVLALVGASLPSAAQATATHYQLNIPRQPLDSALKDFARQTGLQVARFTDVSSGTAEVGPVAGTLTSEEALRTLLGQSELTYWVLRDRTIAVVSKQAAAPARDTASQSSTDQTANTPEDRAKQDEQKAGRSFWDRFRLANVDQGTPADATSVRKESSVAQKPVEIEEVVVTGIRYSVESSLTAKRAAIQDVEVVTSEDIGKLPDKNVADVLQRIPGVNTQSAASGEGGFDENNRVSIRGTPASLTQTTINGHAVATGDWFITDQSSTAGRSVSYDLLPSEMVARTVVYKTQSADMVEGGVAGTVDLQTPRPLDFKQRYTASALIGGAYSDLPAKADPQANLLLSWQNGQFGLLGMGFFEKRDTRRDGQEVLGYQAIPANLAAAWQAANPSVPNATGAQFPTLIGESLFQQTRKREGGLLDLQAKPSDTLSFDLNVFYSHLDADNRNDNPLFFGSRIAPSGYKTGSPVLVPSSLTIQNGTVTAATFPTIPGQPINDSISTTGIPYNTFVYDQIVRPGDVSETEFIDLSAKWEPTDKLTLDGEVGFTYGLGDTPVSEVPETQGGNGASFQLNGVTSPATVSFAGVNTANPNTTSLGFAFGDINHTIDKEAYVQLNGLVSVDSGIFQSIKAGFRFASHQREDNYIEKPGCAICNTPYPPLPAYTGGEYPANYRSSIDGGGGFAGNVYTYSDAAILNFASTALTHGFSRYYWPGSYDVKENDVAFYVMANIGGDHWSGNFGVRFANTLEEVLSNVQGGPDPIKGSLFGSFTPTKIDNHYFDALPSINLKFDLAESLSLHFSAAQTMARPDYSALGGSVALTDLNDTAAGGNPNLKPVRSANYDTTLAWYYAPQSLLELGLFYMDLSSYVDFGTYTAPFFNSKNGAVETYTVTAPFNTTAQIKGVELGWTQPLVFGFGALANLTYADGATGTGTPVVGNSKYTYNIGAYFERWGFSANLDYTFRSHYLVGLDHSSLENEDDWGNLDASATYNFSKNFALNFNVLNITNETIKYYAANKDQPRAFYTNGRQFYFGVRLKL
jgi:iron complex outermembrane receptor protein